MYINPEKPESGCKKWREENILDQVQSDLSSNKVEVISLSSLPIG